MIKMNCLYSYTAKLDLAAAFNKNVIEIGAYCLQLVAGLALSQRLNAEEKRGQLAFLVHQWEREFNC